MTILTACKCVALLALSAALASVPLNFGAPRYLVDRLTDNLVAALEQQLTGGRADAQHALGDAAIRLEAQLSGGRRDLRAESALWRAEVGGDLGETVGILDRRIALVQRDLNAHGVILEQLAAHELDRAVDGWDQVATEAQATLAESRRMVHDLHPQALGLVAAAKVAAGELATTGREWQRAAPVFIESGKSITGNVDSLTISAANIGKNLERLTKPHWYDRIIGYGLNGAVMYRSLNPATNLTIKGAQVIPNRSSGLLKLPDKLSKGAIQWKEQKEK